MPEIVVMGSYLVGVSMQIDAFPAPGQTIVAEQVSRDHGGKGSNQAVQAARCGARVRLLSAVGLDEPGLLAARQWAAERVETHDVERLAEIGTGIGFILVNRQGENEIVIDRGASAKCDAAFVRRHRAAFANAKIVLSQLEVPIDGAVAALEEGRRQGAVTILNPAPAPDGVPDTAWDVIDILIPNEGEAESLGHAGSIQANGRRLVERVGRAVIVTAGADGAFLFLKSGEVIPFPALDVTAVDTTGAGDAFIGAFAAMLVDHDDLVAATRFAVAAGGLACTRRGVLPALHGRADIFAAAKTLAAPSGGLRP